MILGGEKYRCSDSVINLALILLECGIGSD